jgi:hypothetical protein
MSDETSDRPRERGPLAYEYWRAFNAQAPTCGAMEWALFTDAWITGDDPITDGPFRLLNTGGGRGRGTVDRPAVALRIELMEPGEPDLSDMDRTVVDRYHGGGINDEVAALLALSLGIRMQAGRVIRRFDPGGDPRGRPCEWLDVSDPVFLRDSQIPVIHRAMGTHCLNDARLLTTLPDLQSNDAVALVRAARLYQDAMWVAESQPHLAWLMFVSSVEVAAQHWHTADVLPGALLEDVKPDLHARLVAAGGEELAESVAAEIAHLFGSTRKFVSFVLAFLPDPPPIRPPEFAQHSWSSERMKRSMRKIYDWRSRALHDGTPFPVPMCDPPWGYGDSSGPPPEIPAGLSQRTLGATWRTADTPMLLHSFEYIVRNALLKWWEGMVTKRKDLNESGLGETNPGATGV